MNNKILVLALIAMFSICAAANAQTAPSYKISKIKIVPYDQTLGEFQPEITPKDERTFFNEISTALFIVAEVSGAAGSYEAKRNIEVTVLEGKKLRTKKLMPMGIINQDGKFYAPVFVEAAFCSEVTVTARIVGQKTVSTLTRKAAFQCGE